MAQIYREGEHKIRPDVYYRYSGRETAANPGAADGINALVMKASWGPLGTAEVFTYAEDVRAVYGDCPGADMAEAMFQEGTSKLYVYRAGGENGAKATLTQGQNVVITAKYEGDFPIKIKVQKEPGGEDKICSVIVGNKAVEVYHIAASGAEAAELAEMMQESAYVTMEPGKEGALAEFETVLTGGADPVVTAEGYEASFYALEPYYYNVICTDTTDEGVQNLLREYVDQAVENGKFPMAVLAADMTKSFEERMERAASFNDEQIAVIGNTYINLRGEEEPEIMAAARLAAAIAATPANRSIIHREIRDGADTAEKFTNRQYEAAIRSGLILFSVSADGRVWFDSGVTTLTEPGENQDEGWKKVKRTKVRNELMHRLDVMMEKKIGKINCDSDGISDVIQAGTSLLEDMAGEKKLLPGGIFALDPSNPKTSDSAWFIVEADDIDTLEKIYLHYKFSNMPTA